MEEIQSLYKSVIKHHLRDSLYIHMRPLPGVRNSIEDYVFNYTGKKWKGSYSKKYRDSSKKLSIKKEDVRAIIANIDFQSLLLHPISDSVPLNNKNVILGEMQYVLIICSRGKSRMIEYPLIIHGDSTKDRKDRTIFWHSDAMEGLISRMEMLPRKMSN